MPRNIQLEQRENHVVCLVSDWGGTMASAELVTIGADFRTFAEAP